MQAHTHSVFHPYDTTDTNGINIYAYTEKQVALNRFNYIYST